MAKKKYYQRPDGLFETSRTVNGKRVKFRGKSCAEVDRKILEYNIRQEKGRKVPVIADEWLAQKEKDLRQNSYTCYDKAAEKVKAAFPGYASDVRPLDVKRFVRNLESEGYSKSTVQLTLTTAKQIFSYAVIAGDIDISPAAEIKKSRNLPQKKRLPLSLAQEQAVANCRAGDWWLLGLVLLYTGCRRGEAMALTWQDVDRKANVIHFNKKINYSFGAPVLESYLKNTASHDAPLLPQLKTALPHHKIGKMFPNKDGEYMSKAQFQRAWRQYLKDAGLDNPDDGQTVTPHRFRHSFVTICYEAGLDTKTTAAYVGDTEDVVRDVYEGFRAAAHFSAADKVSALLELRAAETAKKQA